MRMAPLGPCVVVLALCGCAVPVTGTERSGAVTAPPVATAPPVSRPATAAVPQPGSLEVLRGPATVVRQDGAPSRVVPVGRAARVQTAVAVPSGPRATPASPARPPSAAKAPQSCSTKWKTLFAPRASEAGEEEDPCAGGRCLVP